MPAAPRSGRGSPAEGIDPRLTGLRRVLAVVAHPDDESFGLGGVLSTLHGAGVETFVLCFTHGEASTLHGTAGDLGRRRAAEFAAAARALAVEHTELLDYPDGALAGASLGALSEHVLHAARTWSAGGLLVFDEDGITGHPDHVRATEAALTAAATLDLPVALWTLPREVAVALNAEFATTFIGRPAADMDVRLTVDREIQLRAIAEHRSQSVDNPVLWRRLELLGDSEWLRFLRGCAAPGDPDQGTISKTPLIHGWMRQK